jgi:hypothetical protein
MKGESLKAKVDIPIGPPGVESRKKTNASKILTKSIIICWFGSDWPHVLISLVKKLTTVARRNKLMAYAIMRQRILVSIGLFTRSHDVTQKRGKEIPERLSNSGCSKSGLRIDGCNSHRREKFREIWRSFLLCREECHPCLVRPCIGWVRQSRGTTLRKKRLGHVRIPSVRDSNTVQDHLLDQLRSSARARAGPGAGAPRVLCMRQPTHQGDGL